MIEATKVPWSAYRPDVDGLRAIAVLLVIFFHYFPNQLPGGFIGVDIFFVISGFLISSIIVRDIEARQFSLWSFFARRVLRVFPALIAMLLACLAAGWFLLNPTEYSALGVDASWSAAFLANFRFYLQTGYFDSAAETKPLLHLWSLGIEEQFYIFWPLMLMMLARCSWMKGGALAVFCASFGINIWLADNPAAAFYLPMGRVWELAAGAALALWANNRQAKGNAELAAISGFILLLAGVALIDSKRAFPGWWALLPVVATVLLIASQKAWMNRRILSNPNLVAIGLVSYPLYLWHWPILVFVRGARFGAEPTVIMKAVMIGSSFALAFLTYHWIERPVRFGKVSSWKPLATTAGLVLTAAVALVVSGLSGVPARFTPELQYLAKDFQSEASNAYRSGRCFLTESHLASDVPHDCTSIVQPGAPLVALWGDSHAAQLFPGLSALQNGYNFNLVQLTAAGCPPLVAVSNLRGNCVSFNEAALRKISESKPKIVILVARWDSYQQGADWRRDEDAAIGATISALSSSGVDRIVLVGQFPIWTLAPARILIRQSQWSGLLGSSETVQGLREFDRTHLVEQAFDAEPSLRPSWASGKLHLLSPRKTLCSDGACRLLMPGRPPQPSAWDESHLTVAASVFFVRSNAKVLLGLADE